MPIIGNGDIASVLPKSDLLFFASGVSNSQCNDESAYKRELDLLLDQPRDVHLVYFSSLAVLSSRNRYTAHKRWMELAVKREFPLYTIVRIGNIEFGSNPNTIINYLKNKIASNQEFEVQDVYRYLVSKDEFLYWVNLIPDWSCEMNIPGRRVKVEHIVKEVRGGRL